MTPSYRSTRDVILCTDAPQDEVVAFYEKALGYKVFHRDDRLVGFETGAFRLYVEKGLHHGPVFEFLVPEVAAARTRLVAAGCTVVEENTAVPRCYVRDRFGLVFNVGPGSSE